ncbi:MAG: STAS domain-containing protein [Fuerstiella sp.]|nr:STAS domain-containing protein [Fuerstiella sp.]
MSPDRSQQLQETDMNDMPNTEFMESDTPPSGQYALTDDGALKVYSIGETTVLGFDGKDVPSEFNAAHYRAAITDLLKANNCSTVAFDVAGVRLIPSGMLGLLISLRKTEGLSPTVQLFNPSSDIEDVLQITKLNTMIEVHHVT